VWVVVTIIGMAVELAAIVLLGRSVTRRFEDTRAEVARGMAEFPGDGGPRRITVELPSAVAADPAAERLLVALSRELSRTGFRVRLESPAEPARPVPGPVPEPRREPPAPRSAAWDGAGGG
jgi:hypothetical protein